MGNMILDEAAAYANERILGDDDTFFTPTWALVAQWDKVHPFPHGEDDLEGIDLEYIERVRPHVQAFILIWCRNMMIIFYIYLLTKTRIDKHEQKPVSISF